MSGAVAMYLGAALILLGIALWAGGCILLFLKKRKIKKEFYEQYERG